MAEGEPPHSDKSPLRALYVIPRMPPPTLKQPTDFSEHFNDFLHKALIKNPQVRWSAGRLLAHPFVCSALPCKQTLLESIVAAKNAPPATMNTDTNSASAFTFQRKTQLGFVVAERAEDDNANDNGLFSSVIVRENVKTGPILPISREDPTATERSISSPKLSPAVTCAVCSKRVYVNERVDALGQAFHRGCFRCFKCQHQLLGRYEQHAGKPYCAAHFAELRAAGALSKSENEAKPTPVENGKPENGAVIVQSKQQQQSSTMSSTSSSSSNRRNIILIITVLLTALALLILIQISVVVYVRRNPDSEANLRRFVLPLCKSYLPSIQNKLKTAEVPADARDYLLIYLRRFKDWFAAKKQKKIV